MSTKPKHATEYWLGTNGRLAVAWRRLRMRIVGRLPIQRCRWCRRMFWRGTPQSNWDQWQKIYCSHTCMGRDGDDSLASEDGESRAWFCVCGEYVESEFCCPKCSNEPPWGCDCGLHDPECDGDEQEEYFDDVDKR